MQGGHWGIIYGLPDNLVPDTSIKNGWTYYASDGWHVNCLAINPAWVLNVMVRVQGNAIVPSVPASVCQSVARQLTIIPDSHNHSVSRPLFALVSVWLVGRSACPKSRRGTCGVFTRPGGPR
jgi:hypothetical protein